MPDLDFDLRSSSMAIPLPRSPIIGRASDIARASEILLQQRVGMLTLTGPPGIGKTRLALQVAADLQHAFAHGVIFVPLAKLQRSDEVPSAIVTALNLGDARHQSPEERLRSFLVRKELLLVLDNCEHLVGAGPFLAELLAICPALKILATSRALFRVTSEHDFPVPPLELPDPARSYSLGDLAETPAVALFVQRATEVDPSFALSPQNSADVVEICSRLDGLPLAIELAAARTRVLAPATLRTRLVNRLLLLSDGPRDQPPRLRSMRDAIAWSYDLLSPEEQAHFRLLSVFAGGFTPDTVTAITLWLQSQGSIDPAESFLERVPKVPSPSLFRLGTSLVEKSLVQPIGDAAGHPRFQLLETIREFGLEQLAATGDETAVREAHARTFLALAECAVPDLRGPNQASWFKRLEAEHANLLAALDWVQARGDLTAALRLASALGRFWEARGHLNEGRIWLTNLLQTVDQSPGADVPRSIKASAESWAGILAHWQGDYREADRLFNLALLHYDNVDDERSVAFTLLNLGQSATCEGKLDLGRQLIEQSLDRFQRIGDAWGVASARTGLVNPLLEAGELDAVYRLLTESLPLARQVNDPDLLAMTLINVGWLAIRRGEDNLAEAALQESRALFHKIGERRTLPYTLNLLGDLAWRRGDRVSAASLFTEALALSRDLGSQLAVINSLTALATVAIADARPAQAARLLGSAGALRSAIGAPIQPIERVDSASAIEALRAMLGQDAFNAAYAAGAIVSVDTAIADGFSLARELASAEPMATPGSTAAEQVLSPREVDVLRLLVEGHSNAEIGARLFVSHRTVRNHLTSIFTKLGVESRTAAATYALRNHLV